ncbi:MAG: hypothetical protein FWE27_04820 [Defluviitaleaceae bacterium]|nr:hypothetical protein [Defluviitaleaceae bacterium]
MAAVRCEEHKRFTFEGCPVDICEDITVRVPIDVCAHSEVCDIQFRCMGHTIERDPCSENERCSKFSVIQKINVRIPLIFKVEGDVGEGFVDFDLRDCNQEQVGQ